MLTFQQIISQLTTFWANQRCAIVQGHDIEVGAGTFNPSTFLRSLGPEPFSTVYVEPSRRPQDGRFGDNPNRVQLFHQLQVIMKPSPLDIQKIYLQSLEAIGFPIKDHDIRFVHDDWESPTLGAWGLGWEVWLDGMEVTQFTYFQSIAGMPLRPITVELTYGLERLAMILQNVNNIFDIQWDEKLTYRDIFHRSEVEWSHYNFHHASTEMWARHFEDFQKEAKNLAQCHLPLPAYDFVIKASHAFNMLEARGVLSVTERGGYIARVRELAKLAATEYLASREKMGFPLFKPEAENGNGAAVLSQMERDPKEREDFLLEIGSEELPATFVPIGSNNLKEAMRALLESYELKYGAIETYSTPRRLAVIVKELSFGSETKREKKKGPPLSMVYDERGAITKQGQGFFSSIGLEHPPSLNEVKNGEVTELQIEVIKNIEYLVATLENEGVTTFQMLQSELPKLIGNLNFPKKMRWGSLNVSYARPLRWIVAMHGSEVIPFEMASITSGSFSVGHRQRDKKECTITHPSNYVSELRKHQVEVDVEARKENILSQLEEIEKQTETIALEKSKVLKEVLNLCEWPELTYASFDPKFLDVPQEVLTSEMVEHQRYFPLKEQNGALKNLFVITADNKPNETIKKGNERVLSARLADGAFLYHQDLESSLDDFGAKLSNVIFQKDLGTVADKRDRIKHFAVTLAQALKFKKEDHVVRAAILAKADLTTQLVQEFPELQGTIGRHYAEHQKEASDVAIAIEEHWLPKYEGGPLPQSDIGAIVSLADKLDNLLGYFSVGLKPTSSSDPYALRRQTIGIIKLLVQNKWSLDLDAILERGCTFFDHIQDKEALVDEVLVYLTTRAKKVYEDYGFKKDEIAASLQGKCIDPYDQYLKTHALHTFRKGSHFEALMQVYKRAKGQIAKQTKEEKLSEALLSESAEKALFDTLQDVKAPIEAAVRERDYQAAFELLAKLQDPLAVLFDEVKILDDDPKIQANRIALLQAVFSQFAVLLDFGKIQIL